MILSSKKKIYKQAGTKSSFITWNKAVLLILNKDQTFGQKLPLKTIYNSANVSVRFIHCLFCCLSWGNNLDTVLSSPSSWKFRDGLFLKFMKAVKKKKYIKVLVPKPVLISIRVHRAPSWMLTILIITFLWSTAIQLIQDNTRVTG